MQRHICPSRHALPIQRNPGQGEADSIVASLPHPALHKAANQIAPRLRLNSCQVRRRPERANGKTTKRQSQTGLPAQAAQQNAKQQRRGGDGPQPQSRFQPGRNQTARKHRKACQHQNMVAFRRPQALPRPFFCAHGFSLLLRLFQQAHRMGGNALLLSLKAQLFGGGGLYADGV